MSHPTGTLRFLARAAALLVAGASILACSAAPAPDGTAPRVSMNRANCASAGIDIERCPPEGGGDDDPTPIPARTYATCSVDSTCSSVLKSPNPYDYDPAFVADPPGSLNFVPARAFTAALKGCSEEYVYTQAWRFSSLAPVAYVFCPAMPVMPSSPLIGTLPCDTCTGAAPAGWAIVAWELSPAPFIEMVTQGRIKGQPGSGCDEIACLGAWFPSSGTFLAPVPLPPKLVP